MKIKGIVLKNFQAHARTEIDLSPGITTIIGDSDVGKSAVLRGLRWTLLNDFAGDDFVREGAKEADVQVVVRHNKEDYLIKRAKGARGNSYWMDYPPVDGQVGESEPAEFKAFGQSVPAEIAKVLQVSSLNFQGQFDEPFWFGLRGSEVASELNSIIDLSVIDTSLANIGKLVYRARTKVGLCQDKLKDSEEKLEALGWVQKRAEQFNALKKTHEDATQHSQKIEKLIDLLDSIKQLRVDEQIERSVCARELFTLAKKVTECQGRTYQMREMLKRLDELNKTKRPPPFLKCETRFKEWRVVQNKTYTLSSVLDQITSSNERVLRTKNKAAAAHKELHKQTKGHDCPLCEQIISA